MPKNNEEYKLDIEPLVFRDRAISIKTKKGKRAAIKMANRIVEGKERIENVPQSYKNYINGYIKGSIPTSQAINKAGEKIAPILATTAVAPWLISGGATVLTNPMVKRILDIVGTIDGVRNAASKNGIRKTIRLTKEGDIKGAVKSGLGDTLDIIGGLGFIDDAYRYGKGASKRLAESVVRIGDAATSVDAVKKQILNKNALNYILNPYANPNIAYNLPYKYSGESLVTIAHKGDIVDKYFRKVPIKNSLDKNTIPKGLTDYINKYYKNKDIKYIDLGKVDFVGTENMYSNKVLELKDGQNILLGEKSPTIGKYGDDFSFGSEGLLDPGGYNALYNRKGDDLIQEGFDIWKFKSDDYRKRYSNSRNYINKTHDILLDLGLKFIDSQGSPLVHKFTYKVPNFFKNR